MSVRYERKNHVITTITVDDEGHVSRIQKSYKSTNAAKRASVSLQRGSNEQGILGRGVLRVIT